MRTFALFPVKPVEVCLMDVDHIGAEYVDGVHEGGPSRRVTAKQATILVSY